jgi:hypothetical protein
MCYKVFVWFTYRDFMCAEHYSTRFYHFVA